MKRKQIDLQFKFLLKTLENHSAAHLSNFVLLQINNLTIRKFVIIRYL